MIIFFVFFLTEFQSLSKLTLSKSGAVNSVLFHIQILSIYLSTFISLSCKTRKDKFQILNIWYFFVYFKPNRNKRIGKSLQKKQKNILFIVFLKNVLYICKNDVESTLTWFGDSNVQFSLKCKIILFLC